MRVYSLLNSGTQLLDSDTLLIKLLWTVTPRYETVTELAGVYSTVHIVSHPQTVPIEVLDSDTPMEIQHQYQSPLF